MIIYSNTKGGFVQDVRDNIIAQKIEDAFFLHCIQHNNKAEYRSWSNSMQYMRNVVDDSDISDDCRVAIEYQLPYSGKRIDFLIAGEDEHQHKNVVVIELKQWESSEATQRQDIVRAFTGGAIRSVAHPSYQAYSYAKIIEEFNESVSISDIHVIPCAYLHNYNYNLRHNIDETYYADAVKAAPIFLGCDGPKLRTFIKQYVRKRSGENLLMTIENGRLRPSKSLQDTLSSILKGKREFYLIDEQKVAYETVRRAVKNSLKDHHKFTIIVQGGPGTGKSVVAIQLLCDLIKQGHSALYVTKNSAPRNVYFARLRGDNYRLNYIQSLFKGGGSFVDAPMDSVDCILADEAHRLQLKSGMFQNKGEAQVKEIIHAARVSVFFIDEAQRVTGSDAGTVDMIRHYAQVEGSQIIEGDDYNLISQFRCNGSDGYLAFLDSLLELRPTPNTVLDMNYDIRVYDNPCQMREDLRALNRISNRCRMLAGYCYDWLSAKDPAAIDIHLSHGFQAQWNFNSKTYIWAIDANSFDQVGCIHTSQGLEFDYVGVIIGRDLVYRNNQVLTDASIRAKTDASLHRHAGIPMDKDMIIRNTYRTLLSRGQKGCFIYCEDAALAQHIREMLHNTAKATIVEPLPSSSPILEDVAEDTKYISHFPVYSIQAACGRFGNDEPVEFEGWMHVDGYLRKDRSMFIVQASGHSMEPKIQDGDYCLFRRYAGGSREGKIILAEHQGYMDRDNEGAYSIKTYHSVKSYDDDGSWQHESIELRPINPDYQPIKLELEDDPYAFRIIGEFLEVVNPQ